MPSRRASPTLIGAFVLGAVAIAVAAALVLGSGRFFRESTRWVIYFDSSVEGLDVGAPVVFRGVTVGSVTDIFAYVDPTKKIFATPVYIELVGGSVRVPAGTEYDNSVSLLKSWIRDDGLRAQLKPQSLITGKLYVALLFRPDTPLAFKGLDKQVPEIPAVPTQMEEIEETVNAALQRIANLPLEEIAHNLNEVLTRTDERLSDPHLKQAIENLDGALAKTRSVMGKLDSSYGEVEADLRATLAQMQKTLADLDGAVTDAQQMVEPGSPLQYQLLTTLEEVTRSARSLRVLTESISEDPNQLIFGRRRSGEKP